MFQFHHVDPDSKDKQYKRLMSQRLSRRQMDEIDKCVLLCTQCHATIHAQEIKASLKLSVQFESRVVYQTFQGWVQADLRDRALTFVTNEPYLLHPCEVTVGEQTPMFLFATEVSERLFEWMEEIDHHKKIEVFSIRDRRVVLQLTHISENRIAIEQAIKFPLMQMEFHASNVPGEVIFIRNGFALMGSGAIHSDGIASYELNFNPSARSPH